jgi:hypothetical protein
VRAEWVVPRFAPLVVLAVLPVASAALGIHGLRTGGPRGRHALLLGIAALELVWAVLASAMIGFAIAGRSG